MEAIFSRLETGLFKLFALTVSNCKGEKITQIERVQINNTTIVVKRRGMLKTPQRYFSSFCTWRCVPFGLNLSLFIHFGNRWQLSQIACEMWGQNGSIIHQTSIYGLYFSEILGPFVLALLAVLDPTINCMRCPAQTELKRESGYSLLLCMQCTYPI